MILTDEQKQKTNHFFVTEMTGIRGEKTFTAVPKMKHCVFGNTDEYESVYGKITLTASSQQELLDLIMKAEPIVI